MKLQPVTPTYTALTSTNRLPYTDLHLRCEALAGFFFFFFPTTVVCDILADIKKHCRSMLFSPAGLALIPMPNPFIPSQVTFNTEIFRVDA